MPLLAPLNDQGCLGKLHASVSEYMQTEAAKSFAAQFSSIPELCRFIRHLEQRDDLGDPRDGPRLSCDVTQRLRLPAFDPNCFERLALFLALALLINPRLQLTSATMMMDNGLHSFPVEMRDGRPQVVVLDPITGSLRNAMSATAYQLRNASPLNARYLAPWFTDLARTAHGQRCAAGCFPIAMDSLRRSVLTGRPLRNAEQINCVISGAYEDAQLFGAGGRTAFDRVEGSLRNLATKVNTKQLQKFLAGLLENAEPLASEAIKAALIAKLGPIGAIALQGLELGTAAAKPAEDKKPETSNTTPPEKQSKPTTREEKRQRMRRMTFAFRGPKNKES